MACRLFGAVIWTNDGLLLIGPLGKNFSQIRIKSTKLFIQENAFKNIVCNMAASFVPSLNMLIYWPLQCGCNLKSVFSMLSSWLNFQSIHPYRAYLILTHWDRLRVTHICVGNLTIISSDNGLLPGRRQTVFWTNAGKLLIGPLGTNFSEILIKIHKFSFKKMHLKMLSGHLWPFCLSLDVLKKAIVLFVSLPIIWWSWRNLAAIMLQTRVGVLNLLHWLISPWRN